MLQGLRTCSLHVADLTAARDWYAAVLGKPPYFDQPFYVGFDVGGFELGIQPAEGAQQPGLGGTNVYWAVPDVAAGLAALVDRGATLESAAQEVGGGIIVGGVIDPFGNRLGLIFNPHFHLSAAQAGGDAVHGPVAVVDAGHRLGAAPGDLAERRIVHEKLVPASPAAVWPLWTTSEGVRWLVASAHIELRIGGPYELYFLDDAMEGSRGSEGCRVLSFVPERLLSFTWNAPPHLELTRPQHTWVVVELEAVAEGTRVRVTHLGWPASGWNEPGTQWPETFAYFDRAWAGVLAELEQHVRGKGAR